ncbi:hypothetical protein [Sphingomonas sp. LT1P40]|uniref:hypothetical protein n=1 Tax=Alteristakelama amylovorans TaxID=3096166 RepID=UPI002FCC722E
MLNGLTSIIQLLAAVLIVCGASAANAKESSTDLTQHLEVGHDASLPRIFQGLRRHLKDPGTISDFALCPEPRKIKWKDGKPVRWTYMFSLNARNGIGGYAGLQPYAAVLYADGRVDISSLLMPGSDGLAAIANQLIERDMAKCPYLSKDKLKSLVEANL